MKFHRFRRSGSSTLRVLLSALLVALVATAASAGDWPSFRGPIAAGVADGENLPTHWNVDSGEGLRWTVRVPGLAHSSPVVRGDRICVTSALPGGRRRRLQARPLR